MTDYNKFSKLLSMQTIFKKLVGLFFDTIESVVVALSIFVVFYLFIVQPHQVKGASMDPTFHDGEYILTDKIDYRLHAPQRGDVIVFIAPRNPDYDYIKRIIGIPGDTVSIKDGSVYVNNQLLEENYINSETIILPGEFVKNNQEIKLQTDEYFVLGDNRSHSSDSRSWGTVPRKDIIGRAFFRYWPFTKFGMIQKPEVFKKTI